VTKRVTEVLRGRTNCLLDVMVDGEIISATLNHRFWVDCPTEWVEARDLQPGMCLRQADLSLIAIVDVHIRQTEVQETYNFTIEDVHNYFVGERGFLVHNGGETKYTVYFGYSPTDTTFSKPIYVGMTGGPLSVRETKHRAEALDLTTPQHAYKKDIRLVPKLDELTLVQAKYHEAAIYHSMAEKGHNWGNLQEPRKIATLQKIIEAKCV
jgi:hypothetical protein